MKNSLERRWLLLALGAVLAIAVFQWGIVPAIRYGEALHGRIAAAQKNLAELTVLDRRFQELTNSQATLGRQMSPPTFQLLSYIQESTDRLGIKPHIESMRPTAKDIDATHREDSVHVVLSKVPLAILVPYLHHLETGLDSVWIAQASCHPDTVEGMDLELTISTIVEKPLVEPTRQQDKRTDRLIRKHS
jgi:type II secretory pathway component PulM